MTVLSFTLAPASVAHIHELLLCLAKFDEDVMIEATSDHLRFSSLNISKTALGSFKLEARSFFTSYQYYPDVQHTTSHGARTSGWTCQLQNRALLSIFKRRSADGREKEAGLDYLETVLDAKADQAKCRLIVKMICRQGVVKTYRLTYEAAEASHPSFDKTKSVNRWTISSRTLRDVVEYFGPKTDQLDWYLEDEKLIFTSYTEKVQVGKEILKQPMYTSVALERKDFDTLDVEERLHIGISVKDFRAIITHAEVSHARVTSTYSHGNRPMQITYETEGVIAEYTLMTRRSTETASSSTTAGTPARGLSMRPISQPPRSERAPSIPATTQRAESVPRPAVRPAVHDEDVPRTAQPLQRLSPPPTASLNPQSLFIPADDDQTWDEPNYDEPDQVTWAHDSDLPADSNTSSRIRDSEPTSFQTIAAKGPADMPGIPPTQRLSQIRGLF